MTENTNNSPNLPDPNTSGEPKPVSDEVVSHDLNEIAADLDLAQLLRKLDQTPTDEQLQRRERKIKDILDSSENDQND